MCHTYMRVVATLQDTLLGTYPKNVVGGVARFVLIYDNQTNGSLPLLTDVFEDPVAGAIVTPFNPDGRNRFVVLADQVKQLSTTYPHQIFEVDRPVDLPMIFNDSLTGSVADINSGSLIAYIATSVQDTTFGLFSLGCYFWSRIQFTDI